MTTNERAAFYAYRLLARFAEILPVSGIRFLAGVAGRLGPRFSPAKAALVRSNIRRVTGQEPGESEVREAFASYIRYWLQAFRLPIVPQEYLERVLEVEGLEHIKQAQAAGKGVVFALPHVGNWDVAGAWFTSNDVPLSVVVERLQPVELHEWFENFRSSLGMSVVVNDDHVAGVLIAALKRGEAIALLCDRDVDGTGGDFEFFGEVTKLPKGPATLALRTGAALIPFAVFETPTGFRAVVDAPVQIERSGAGLRSDVDLVTQRLTRRIEALIRQEPSQWHLFQPNWPSDRSDSTGK